MRTVTSPQSISARQSDSVGPWWRPGPQPSVVEALKTLSLRGSGSTVTSAAIRGTPSSRSAWVGKLVGAADALAQAEDELHTALANLEMQLSKGNPGEVRRPQQHDDVRGA